jgi:hypothetical protein
MGVPIAPRTTGKCRVAARRLSRSGRSEQRIDERGPDEIRQALWWWDARRRT